MWVHYQMTNTSTRSNEVNHLTISVYNTMTDEIVGTARLNSFTDIYLELPDAEGKYKLRPRLIKQLEARGIDSLEELLRFSWLLNNGETILHNIEKV